MSDDRRVLAHLSDLHLVRPGSPLLGGRVDPFERLRSALDVLTTWDIDCDAWVFSGDLSDDGSPESYRILLREVSAAASGRGVRIIWGNGNHDDRAIFRRELLGSDVDGPVNEEYDLDGQRVLSVDTVVAGVSWGEVSPGTLEWLAERLETRARLGTVLVLHHAPLPQPQTAANLLWPLRNPHAVAEAVSGTDVRAILSGHFHQPSFGTIAGVPVMAATALSHSQDLTVGRTQRGQDAHQGFSLIEVHPHTVVSTPIFLDAGPQIGAIVTDADARHRFDELSAGSGAAATLSQ